MAALEFLLDGISKMLLNGDDLLMHPNWLPAASSNRCKFFFFFS